MGLVWALWMGWFVSASASGQPATGQPPSSDTVSGSLTLSTAMVAGPVAASGPDGQGTFKPAIDLALTLRGRLNLYEGGSLSAVWGLGRGFRVCDTCGDGFNAGSGAGTTPPLETTDLSLLFRDSSVVSWSDDSGNSVAWTLGGDLTLPASRDSLVCNPMYAAVGLVTGLTGTVSGAGALSADTGATRAFHRYTAPPTGSCATAIRDYAGTETATGIETPQGWESPREGRANPAWSFRAGLTWRDWHQIFGPVGHPGGIERVFTSVRVGWIGQIRNQQPASTVATATGDVDVEPSATPLISVFPVSATAGVVLHEHLNLGLTVSNAVPRLLADPSAHLTWLPSRTSLSLDLTGTF